MQTPDSHFLNCAIPFLSHDAYYWLARQSWDYFIGRQRQQTVESPANRHQTRYLVKRIRRLAEVAYDLVILQRPAEALFTLTEVVPLEYALEMLDYRTTCPGCLTPLRAKSRWCQSCLAVAQTGQLNPNERLDSHPSFTRSSVIDAILRGLPEARRVVLLDAWDDPQIPVGTVVIAVHVETRRYYPYARPPTYSGRTYAQQVLDLLDPRRPVGVLLNVVVYDSNNGDCIDTQSD